MNEILICLICNSSLSRIKNHSFNWISLLTLNSLISLMSWSQVRNSLYIVVLMFQQLFSPRTVTHFFKYFFTQFCFILQSMRKQPQCNYVSRDMCTKAHLHSVCAHIHTSDSPVSLATFVMVCPSTCHHGDTPNFLISPTSSKK